MSENIDFRGLINPLPGIPVGDQHNLIAKYKPSEIYTIGKVVTLQDVIKQQRAPRAVLVSHTACVVLHKGKKAERFARLLDFKDEIHDRDGFIFEALTQRRSDIRADWNAMKEDAQEVFRRLCMGAKSAINGRRGVVAYDYNDKDLLTLLRIMTPSVYPNDKERITAIADHGVKPVPQRTWLLVKLKPLARERGLLK